MAWRTQPFGVAHTGLSTVGYKLRSAAGTLGSRITAGVSELVAGSGLYTADVDESSSPIGIVWDTGAGGATVYGYEDFLDVAVWAAAPDGVPLSAFAAAVWDELQAGHAVAGSFGLYLDEAISGISAGSGATPAEIWAHATRTLSAGTNIVLAKGVGVTGFNDLSAAAVNAEVDTALVDVGLTTTITGRIDAATSTRSPASTALSSSVWTAEKAGFIDAAISGVSTGGVSAGAIADAVWDEARSGHTTAGTFGQGVASVTGAVASVTAGVTVTTNSDKAGYALGATGLDAIPVTLTGAPSTFREWLVWLTLRFRRTHRDKTSGVTSVYGSNGSTVVTTQATTDTVSEQTTGVPS